MDISLDPDLLLKLLEELTKKAKEKDLKYSSLSVKNISIKTQASFFGTGAYKIDKRKKHISLGHAINSIMEKKHGSEKPWVKNFAPKSSRYSPVKLEQYYSCIKSKKPIRISETYWKIFLDFLEKEQEDFIQDLEPKLQESFITKNKQIELATIGNYVEKPQRKIIYNCYCIEHSGEDHLQQFKAEFTTEDNKPIAVKLTKTPSKDDYLGEVKIYGNGSEIHLVAQTKVETKNIRPLSIIISHQIRKSFEGIKILLGNFINIGPKSNGIQGIVLFEQIQEDEQTALNVDLVELFLNRSRSNITVGGFISTTEFHNFVIKKYPNWKNEKELYQKMDGRCYEVFILTNKGKQGTKDEPLNRIEKALFKFEKKGKLICKSFYPSGTITYNGYLEYHSKSIAILHLYQSHPGTYQIILDLHDTELKQISGVYSGVTQDSSPAGGRAIAFQIEAEDYVISEPRLYDPDKIEMNDLLVKHPNLKDFLSGKLDNFIDNTNFFNLDIRFTSTDKVALNDLPGTYYYYRTRTIQGHPREVKRYPFLIMPNGEFFVKVKINSTNQVYTATGQAFNLNDRVYMHIFKKNIYDGLAILYPKWRKLENIDEQILAVYASTSKQFHLMAGRLIFRKISDDTSKKTFNTLNPLDINIDDASHVDSLDKGVEKEIIHDLVGQINNFVAVRHSNQQSIFKPGENLFYAACYHAMCERYTEALDVLEISILNGGYRDIETLQKEFAEDGALINIKEQFKNLPKKHNPKEYQAEDVIEYLKKLMAEIFP